MYEAFVKDLRLASDPEYTFPGRCFDNYKAFAQAADTIEKLEQDIVRMIKSEPAADVREVVICEKCRHWNLESGGNFCLVKRLKKTSEDFGKLDSVSVLLLEAADAIEKLKKQNTDLRNKIRRMKSDASWDEDIRRGQVQGMW